MAVHIQDAIHGLIEVPPLCLAIIDTPTFKRLKRLSQLGVCHHVYPSARHSRFEHSIGTMHLAGKFVRALQTWYPDLVDERDVMCIQVAGLCHDLGHGAFSHLWEDFVKAAGETWNHEKTSIELLDRLLQRGGIDLEQYGLKLPTDLIFIKELINGPEHKDEYQGRPHPDKAFLYELISNKVNGIDVDKWDYFQRDAQALGIDIYLTTNQCERFIASSRIVDWTPPDSVQPPKEKKRLCVSYKETENVQNMWSDRSRLHRNGYKHRVVKIAEKMTIDILLLADEHLMLTGTNGRRCKLSEAHRDPEAFLKISDSWLLQTIQNSDDPNLEPAKLLLERLESRKLYRTLAQLDCDGADAEKLEKELKEICEKIGIDVCIIKKRVDMGSFQENPAQKVLFLKRNRSEDVKGHVYTMQDLREERHTFSDLRRVAPTDLSSELAYIVCREESQKGAAAEAVKAWADEVYHHLHIEML